RIATWKSVAASSKSRKKAPTTTSTSSRKNISANPSILSASPAKSASPTKSNHKESARWAEKRTQSIRLFFTQNLHRLHAGRANCREERSHCSDSQYQDDDTQQGCYVRRRDSVEHSGQHVRECPRKNRAGYTTQERNSKPLKEKLLHD